MTRYKNIFKYIGGISIFFILFATSCISPSSTNLLQQRDPIYSTPTDGFKEYKLQINDEINCVILTSNTELANEFNGIITSSEQAGGSNRYYVIHENGEIYIPYIDEIEILGLTLREAEVRIQQKMQLVFPDAQVRVSLRNNLFYIVSSTRNGTYGVFKENMTIYQALSLSGNINENIDLTKVKIIRHENGKDVIKTFNLRTESVIESEFYYIKPNDVIYYSISKSSFFRVDSFWSLVSTVLAPVGFLGWAIAYKGNF